MTEDTLALPMELLGSIERYAVYRCYSDDGQLLYVGETGDLGTRFASHAKKLWFVQVRGITLEWYADELDALKAERRAIHVEHPKYNKVHRSMTNAQAARKKGGKQVSRTPRPRRTQEEVMAAALEIRRQEPGISASALGRRLGLTDSRGRQIARKLAAAAPKGQDPEETS